MGAVFKSRLGATPRKYRQRYRKEEVAVVTEADESENAESV
jgi:hypothetical protein